MELEDSVTWVDGADAIGERLGAAAAEIFGEKGKPCVKKLRSDSKLRRLIIDEERVDVRLRLLVVFIHGDGEQEEETETQRKKEVTAIEHDSRFL